ncbi:hypothetical protein DL89DRAFT_290831 [Linderina pennispora]|uniref:Uncharacterized protein n=1 Tax=Linderina pennispora TaxID=61395 RepID=A0A1Y1WHK9_9FUNG|nr:uncharacterized protein DL89DRAFT_290831 [Linderina pennispora]ORX73060.1 hypothetical protein DL89DRAFT_290831 [Linderina pennispora]
MLKAVLSVFAVAIVAAANESPEHGDVNLCGSLAVLPLFNILPRFSTPSVSARARTMSAASVTDPAMIALSEMAENAKNSVDLASRIIANGITANHQPAESVIQARIGQLQPAAEPAVPATSATVASSTAAPETSATAAATSQTAASDTAVPVSSAPVQSLQVSPSPILAESATGTPHAANRIDTIASSSNASDLSASATAESASAESSATAAAESASETVASTSDRMARADSVSADSSSATAASSSATAASSVEADSSSGAAAATSGTAARADTVSADSSSSSVLAESSSISAATISRSGCSC